MKKHLKVDVKEAKILDLGCGERCTQMAIFKADGINVTGMDVVSPTYKMGLKTFSQVTRNVGLLFAIKSFLRNFFFDKRFFSTISLLYKKRVCLNGLDTCVMSGERLCFPDNCFDFVYSFWVFEHIVNVSNTVKEVNRVLKPSGVACIHIHLFPSVSGGHHPNWLNGGMCLSGVPVWDHLLNKRYPVGLYLNELRLDQYRDIFQKHTKVFYEKVYESGSEFLTPNKEVLLKQRGYTKKDLLSTVVVFLCKKGV